jgi:hypothetical protein
VKLINHLLDYSKAWHTPNVYLFTGNPIIKNNGAIVMGRGAAQQVRDTYPGTDIAFGNLIAKAPQAHVLWLSITPGQFLGWFKVKDHWIEPAKTGIIIESTKRLMETALRRADYVFHMNYPGIGNGQLAEHTVAGIIEQLPDNVWVYK